MDAPVGYAWHHETGEFVGQITADPSPLEPGVWLWPARTTQVAPPLLEAGQVVVFVDGEWRGMSDHRGETWYDQAGAPHTIVGLGDPSLVGLTPSYTPPPLTMEQQRAARLADLAERRWQVETGGIVVNGAPIRTDAGSQAKITGAVALFQNDPELNLIDWEAAPGVWVTVDAATMTAIGVAVGRHVQACFSRARALSSVIMAAEDGEALAAVDIDEGWPAS